MIGIKIDGQTLDIDEKTSIRFSLENPLFLADNSTLIPGSYSFPFTLPDSPTNRRLLGYPTEIDNANSFQVDRSVQFCYCEEFLWYATLTVKKSTGKRYKAYMIINPLEDLSKISIKELKTDVRSVGDQITESSMVEHANETIANPQLYDYIFTPVYNPCIYETPDPLLGETDPAMFQNWWRYDLQSFYANPSPNQVHKSMMPFIKVNYVIECIFDHLGIEIQDNPFASGEKNNLLIYNNYSISESDGTWGSSFDISNHLPDCNAAEYLREMLRLQGYMVFTDLRSQSFRFKKIADVLSSQPTSDWSDISGTEYEICEDSRYISRICYSVCDEDKLDQNRPLIVPDELILQNLPFTYPNSTGSYHYYNLNSMITTYVNHDTGFEIEKGRDKPCVKVSDQGNPIEFAAQPTYMAAETISSIGKRVVYPMISMQNTINSINQEGPSVPKIKLIQFRGALIAIPNVVYPISSVHNVLRDWGKVGDCSLHLIGEDGIFEQSWQGQLELYSKNRSISKSFCLTLADLLSFDFCEKVRYVNRNYLVKKLDITFTNKAIRPAKATLVHAQ